MESGYENGSALKLPLIMRVCVWGAGQGGSVKGAAQLKFQNLLLHLRAEIKK